MSGGRSPDKIVIKSKRDGRGKGFGAMLESARRSIAGEAPLGAEAMRPPATDARAAV